MVFGIDDAISAGLQIINKFVPDPEQREKAAFELAQLKQASEFAELNAATQIATAQSETNKVEAASASVFVSGWRPAIGWCCAASLAFYFIPQFALAAIMWVRLCYMKNELLPYPVSIGDVMGLSLNLLGIGALRTVEKIQGVARS